MFHSATLKLTAWYAGIIIAISLLFSVLIYTIASREVSLQLDDYLSSTTLRALQQQKAEHNLINNLAATNLVIWLAGSIGSYYLARRTLRPIEEAHEAQSRFTSDASHELRTPLASMKVELEVALRDPHLQKTEMRELLASNLEEVNKLTNLSQTLLQLSQLDHANITREKVALNATVSSVTGRFKAHSRIALTLPAQPLHVIANEPNVEELLTILVDNALKYSPENSKITVTVTKQKNMAGFEVSNTGDGIPADVLPHIFDRFYRADTSRTGGKKRGYGLGLSLAKKIVELHGGELTASSAPGGVTTFQVLLPLFRKSQIKKQTVAKSI